MTDQELRKTSQQIRLKVLEIVCNSHSSHIGSAFSIIDILVFLYFSILNVRPEDPRFSDRDIFLLSKGHAVAALYVTLAYRGFFPVSDLDVYGQNGTKMAGHVTLGAVPGVEATAGSLGHGLPMACGFALAARMDKKTSRIFCLIGDGECNEGSVWEAAMFAAQKNLNNLVAIIDWNKNQGMGDTERIISTQGMFAKWESFGWKVKEIDGHDFEQMKIAFHDDIDDKRPTVILAHTIKGRGVSWMENNNDWHYKTPDAHQQELARKEIENI